MNVIPGTVKEKIKMRMRMRISFFLLLGLSPVFLEAQNPNGNYNPYVNQGIIFPSPLWPVEENGTGEVRFKIGNTGSDALEVYTDQYVTLTITLSYGEPDHPDPLSAISGTSANLFSWSYSAGTYTGIQTLSIPSGSVGTINIAYRVTQNSSLPGSNGFNVNITPAPYQTASNTQNDDAVSSYTYTEVRDYGDAPASYGTAYHALDFLNYLGSVWDGEIASQASAAADGDDTTGKDDEDGVTFPSQLRQGETVDIPVSVTGLGRLNAWIDWNGDGDFADTGERVADNVSRSNGTENLTVTIPAAVIVDSPTFARFRFTPGTLSSSSGAANGGEIEDYRITISASSLAPTVPTGLIINSFSENSVSISWNASTDNVGVTGYRIYRGGTFLGTSTGLSYTDNTVSAGNSFTYTVSAINAADYESAQSSAVTINIDDITPPAIPTGLSITMETVSAVSLSWNATTDNVGVSGYRIYRMGTLLETTTGLTYTDNSVTVGNSYTYTVSAIDAAGNASEQSSGVTASTNDISPPTMPTGLIVTSTSQSTISLSWNISSDNVEVEGYRIYRNGVLFSSVSNPAITDNTVAAGNTYSYRVSAFDNAGNESAQTDPLSITIMDPSVPVETIIVNSVGGITEVYIGANLQFIANVLPADASNKSVTWSVENHSGGAAINEDGMLTALSKGTVTVVATAGDDTGVMGSMQISISDQKILISSITVVSDGGKKVLPIGYNLEFYVEVLPINATSKDVIWRANGKTGDASITQDGFVLGKSEGTVDVIAISLDGSGKRDTMELTIISSAILISEINASSFTGKTEIGIGGTLQFITEVLPEDATNKNVAWRVENETGEASITQGGFLTAISAGTVKAIVSAQDGSGVECICAVKINDWETGVDENEVIRLLVYPNPSKGIFYLDAGKNDIDLIQVIGYNGAIVIEMIPGSGTGIIQVNLSNAPPGPYFIRIYTTQGIFVKRIIFVL